MNSLFRDYTGMGNHEDRLQKPQWVESFLGRWHLDDQRRPSRLTLCELDRLRDLLWRMAEAVVRSRKPRESDFARLNQIIAAARLRRRLNASRGKYEMVISPARRDWTWIQSEIAADFASLLTQPESRRRLKLCANPDCRWIFYDASKNKTRNWCTSTCGSLINVRRFRERIRRR